MNILYIGQYTPGTTSKMRADQLGAILRSTTFQVIDTHIPFHQTFNPWRSLGFRYKSGPLIWKVNNYIKSQFLSFKRPGNGINSDDLFDLIWVDKAVYINLKITNLLRGASRHLVHFTPDMAFYENRSNNFEKGLYLYDYAITTKSVEIEEYLKLIDKEKLIVATQGFDKSTHKPIIPFSQKENAVAFIGLCEIFRESVLQKLIDNKISVKLAGKGWVKFANKNKNNQYLKYHGVGLFAEKYAQFIASAKFGIGLLSKNFPELHTTRTFEIPACGTALITERNAETTAFFNEDEVIFYDSVDNLVSRVKYLMDHPMELETITNNGYKKVTSGGYDYESILKKILAQMGFI